MIDIVKFLKWKQTFQRGNNRIMAGKAFDFNLGGETDLLSGSSFYAGGAMFQRGRYWGGCVLLMFLSPSSPMQHLGEALCLRYRVLPGGHPS